MGSGSLFLRTRQSHGKTERRWVATVRMPDGSRPSSACPHEHGLRERRPCDEALQKLAELQAIRARKLPLDVRTLTVGRYLERWSTVLTDLAPSTIRQHREIIANHLISGFPMLLTDLRPSDVDAYLAHKDRHPQTLRHHRATLRRALTDAVRDGYIERNPVSLSRAPRIPRKERRYLSAQEAVRLIESSRNDRLWPLWTLLVSTGLRLTEALSLAWSDTDLGGNDAGERAIRLRGAGVTEGAHPHHRAGGSDARGTDGSGPEDRPHPAAHGGGGPSLTVRRQLIRVDGAWRPQEPKTDRSRRTISLTPRAVEALREQRIRQAELRHGEPEPIDMLVFTTSTGAPIHGTNVLPPFRRALTRAGLPRVTLHALRHSYAAIALGAGVPLIVVSRTLGHSSIRITADIYAEVIPELFEDAAERMAKALA